jgi:polyhydroxybutyrate depolymerase
LLTNPCTHDEALMEFARVAGTFSRPALARLTAAGAIFLGAMTFGGAAMAAGCGQPIEQGRHSISFDVGGVTRQGVYFIPSSYTGKDKVAVVFDFHGSNSNPDGQFTRSSWDKVAEKNGFIAVALQGSLSGKAAGTYGWNVPFVQVAKTILPSGDQGGQDEIAFISAAVNTVKQEFCVDPARIFASGYSGGGRMLSAYICSGGEGFSGAGFVNSLRAGRPVETDGKWGPEAANCNPAKPVSIMAFAGIKDQQNPYAGGGSAYWQYGFKTAIQRWTDLDGCKGNDDPKTINGVTFSIYGTCKNGARIASYVFANGTHDWPKPAPAAQAVLAAAQESAAAGVTKVSVVTPAKPAFDSNVDPALRMWDFFSKADSTDLVATAAPAKTNAGAKTGTGIASDCATQAELEGTSCTSSQPINMRRSGQGVQDAL